MCVCLSAWLVLTRVPRVTSWLTCSIVFTLVPVVFFVFCFRDCCWEHTYTHTHTKYATGNGKWNGGFRANKNVRVHTGNWKAVACCQISFCCTRLLLPTYLPKRVGEQRGGGRTSLNNVSIAFELCARTYVHSRTDTPRQHDLQPNIS